MAGTAKLWRWQKPRLLLLNLEPDGTAYLGHVKWNQNKNRLLIYTNPFSAWSMSVAFISR